MYLTKRQKLQIESLRKEGKTFFQISEITDIPEQWIRSYVTSHESQDCTITDSVEQAENRAEMLDGGSEEAAALEPQQNLSTGEESVKETVTESADKIDENFPPEPADGTGIIRDLEMELEKARQKYEAAEGTLTWYRFTERLFGATKAETMLYLCRSVMG